MTDLREYFRQAMNKRRVHIAHLRLERQKSPAKSYWDQKIAHEQHQLEVLESMWQT